jgi:plasmid stability protein
VNLNIKNLDDGVAARLAEQAAAEGMSQQEWLRQVLRRTAGRLSPAELEAQRSGVEPMSAAEFAALQAKVAERRRREVSSVGPSRSRR